jgi:hypothetical protein
VISSGRIGFGIEAYDRQDLAANKNGVYRVIQAVNGTTYTDMVFDAFSFGETRQINTLIDYPYYARYKSRIQKFFRSAGNSLSLYQTLFDDGIIEVNPGQGIEVEIRVSDLAGNNTLLRIPVVGRKLTALEAPVKESSPYYAYAEKPSSFELGKAQVYFPAGSLYEDSYINLSADSLTVQLHDPTLALHRNFTLSYDVSHLPDQGREKFFIARLDDDDRPQFERTYRRGNTFTMRSRTLGRFTLAKDSVAPRNSGLQITGTSACIFQMISVESPATLPN